MIYFKEKNNKFKIPKIYMDFLYFWQGQNKKRNFSFRCTFTKKRYWVCSLTLHEDKFHKNYISSTKKFVGTYLNNDRNALCLAISMFSLDFFRKDNIFSPIRPNQNYINKNQNFYVGSKNISDSFLDFPLKPKREEENEEIDCDDVVFEERTAEEEKLFFEILDKELENYFQN